jgi:hypothetical protein
MILSATRLTPFSCHNMLAQFLLALLRGQSRSHNKDYGAPMLIIDIPLLIAALLFGFAGGYGVRGLKSRQRHRRWREKYWYGRPPISARTALDRSIPVPATQGALSTSHRQSQ